MNPLKQYNIDFLSLSLGKHEFSFEINENFFSCFENSEITKGNLKLDLVLEKQNQMLVFDFRIKGNVELVCDHCLEDYLQEIEVDRRLFVKFGEAFGEQTDEIVVIPDGQIHFDISQYIYEFVHLALPMQRIHSEDGIPGKGCDPAIIEKMNQYIGYKKSATESDENSPWELLKGLKFDDKEN